MALRYLLASLLLAAVWICPSAAQAAIKHSIDIPAQGLGPALAEFAKQTGIQVVYPSDLVAGINSSALVGSMTPEEALTRLLAVTKLKFEFVDAQTVTLTRVRATPGISTVELPAVEEAAPRGAREAETTDRADTQQDDQSHRLKEASDIRSLDKESATEISEVLVTGTRIRRLSNAAAPTRVIDREEIVRSGVSTVEGALNTLPQNFAEISSVGGSFQDGTSNLALGNTDYASAANLRGLGAESTLTLLNGTRRAGSSDGRVFDLSTIPLLAVERIEVVTGGRSAVYGADAVAGVVNVITRRQFEGLEVDASYGFADSGGERLQAGAIGGAEFGKAGVVAAYDYQEEHNLNVVEAGFTRPNFGNFPIRLDAQPETLRHSVYLSGSIEVSSNTELFLDTLWTAKDIDTASISVNAGPPFFAVNPSSSVYALDSEVYSVATGARVDLSEWQVEISAVTSDATTDENNDNVIDIGVFGVIESRARQHREADLTSVSLVFEGPLGSFANIVPRSALGVEYRDEQYARNGEVDFGGFVTTSAAESDRTNKSAFAELLLPILKSEDRQLELSLAGRYDDYSDFGGTFNPQAGVTWSPRKGLTFRTAYASAFRAPVLADLVPSSTAYVQERTDPTSATGVTPVLTLQGTNPALEPEEAETWSAGFDWEFGLFDLSRISVSYFDVDYNGRINIPALGADDFFVLEREDRFGTLIDREPTAAEIAGIQTQLVRPIDNFSLTPWDPSTQSILDAFPNLVIFDNRAANISTESARGVDLSFESLAENRLGQVTFGADVTYTFDHTANITTLSPEVERLNEVGKPVDLRARLTTGWSRGPYSATLFVNYIDEYINPFTIPVSEMQSWTTVDLSLGFNGDALSGALRGLSATLSVLNILESDPPNLLHDNGRFFAYDPTNANALGRYITLSLRKRW